MNNEKVSDTWQTPQDLFNVLDKGGFYQGIEFEGFNFDIDLCATQENSKCDWYCEDYLEGHFIDKKMPERYHGETIESFDFNTAFMNPPYSNPKPFIEKAWEDSKYCKIVCLVKCDPSTRWWSTFWEYNHKGGCPICEDDVREEVHKVCCKGRLRYNGPKPGCEVLFFPKRIKFDPPKGTACCRCTGVHGTGFYVGSVRSCKSCKQPLLTGPTFPSALIIMDRRNV